MHIQLHPLPNALAWMPQASASRGAAECFWIRTLAFLWKRKKTEDQAQLAPSPLTCVHEVDAKRLYGGVLGSDVQWMVGMSGGVDV